MANALGIELKGRRVIVKSGIYRVGETEFDRTFLCDTGFGCHTYTKGYAIIGRFVNHPEHGDVRIEGYEVEKLAEE